MSKRSLLPAGLALCVMMCPPDAGSKGWEKYVSLDGSWSIHHPAGWNVTPQGNMIQIMDPQTSKEINLIFMPNAGAMTADQVADQMLLYMAMNFPGMQLLSRQAAEGGSVLMETALATGGVPYRGVVAVMNNGGLGLWSAYYAPEDAYSLEKGHALLKGVVMSMADGDASRPPVTRAAKTAKARPSKRKRRRKKPAPSPAPEEPAAVAEPGEVPKDSGIEDAWFLPKGKVLRGFYGGAILREELGTYAQTGVNVPDTLHYSRIDEITTGGDFRVAFYTDGTVRAKLLVLNYTPMFSTNEPFLYAGRYTLKSSGRLSTAALPLVNKPETMIEIEKTMTKLRLTGTYSKKADQFSVRAAAYDPQKNKWGALADESKVLKRAVRRKSQMYGTVTNPGVSIGVSGGSP